MRLVLTFALYQAKVIHHINPYDVWVDNNYEVKLSGYEEETLKEFLDQSSLNSRIGVHNNIIDPILLKYRSYEDAVMERCGQHSAIFQLGSFWYKIITGKEPFVCDAEIKSKVVELPPFDSPNVDDILRIWTKMHEKNVDKRYSHFKDLIDDLHSIDNVNV